MSFEKKINRFKHKALPEAKADPVGSYVAAKISGNKLLYISGQISMDQKMVNLIKGKLGKELKYRRWI